MKRWWPSAVTRPSIPMKPILFTTPLMKSPLRLMVSTEPERLSDACFVMRSCSVAGIVVVPGAVPVRILVQAPRDEVSTPPPEDFMSAGVA